MFKTIRAIRTVIKAVRDGKIMTVDCEGAGQTFINKELFQQYGIASKPPAGSEGILLLVDDTNGIVIATEDRRYRISLKNGETGIYTDEGDKIHLKKNKEIHIVTGNKITIDAQNDVFINTDKATVNATGKVAVNASGGVDIDGGTAALTGVLTGKTKCHFTGSTHADMSLNVKASK